MDQELPETQALQEMEEQELTLYPTVEQVLVEVAEGEVEHLPGQASLAAVLVVVETVVPVGHLQLQGWAERVTLET